VFGAGGGTSSYREVEEADVILLWGSNAREAHPIYFHHVLRGVRNGARLIVVDPRRTVSAQWADIWLGLDVGSDVSLANAMGRVILEEGLENRAFIEHATACFPQYREGVQKYTLERAEKDTGVPAAAIREVALAYAKAEKAQLCWTLGITEHHNALDNVFSLINLALLTGHVGRWGSGVVPLRGQNNVQGGGDMGALPNKLPAGHDIENPKDRRKFERAWKSPLPTRRGWHLSRMFEEMEHGKLRSLYAIGENPAQAEADQARALRLLTGLDHLVVQDIFRTRTAELAHVVLPAAASWCEDEGTVTSSERRVQRVRKALDPPGQARSDLWILHELGKRLDAELGAPVAEKVWNELRSLSSWHAGMSYKRLEELNGIQWPCPDESHPGNPFLHGRLWSARPVRAGRERSAGGSDHRGIPDPPDDGTAARLVQHGRADGGLHLAAAPPRNPGHLPRGWTGAVRRRRRDGPRRLAPRSDRSRRALRRNAPSGARVSDAPLPGRRRDEHPDDRRHGSEDRNGGVQGRGHPHREARTEGRARRLRKIAVRSASAAGRRGSAAAAIG
jgi:predicted molibdopterin-dependent oxidoreductase YjgC